MSAREAHKYLCVAVAGLAASDRGTYAVLVWICSPPSSTLVYRKGAYVLALLRKTIGDEAFWPGVRAYTREFNGKSSAARICPRTL